MLGAEGAWSSRVGWITSSEAQVAEQGNGVSAQAPVERTRLVVCHFGRELAL